jgi:hypothetical protein
MPFTTEQLSYAGRISLDWYLKNDPIDQINTERPLLKLLIAGKQEWGGGLQYVQEQLRFSNDSNFQSYFGDQQVTYNRKRTIQVAKYTWGASTTVSASTRTSWRRTASRMTEDKNSDPPTAARRSR